jgi:polar amino acid transport system substrate-binding protein
MGNFLLVVGKDDAGDPIGPSPDMAGAIANALGVPLQLVQFRSPADITVAAGSDQWDIANIGAEPQRAAVMDFTPAYCEIEANYLVPAGSPLQSIEEVDRPGVTISAPAGSAYGLWLENNIRHADLRLTKGNAARQFTHEGLDALAGLRSQLVRLETEITGSRILPGQFTAVQQAVAVNKGRAEALAWLTDFVEVSKASGRVAASITAHGVEGQLSVAPAAVLGKRPPP